MWLRGLELIFSQKSILCELYNTRNRKFMRLTFLGTGTSVGVPTIGCRCKVCTSSNPHDARMRCSAMLETDQTRILIDCGPDFRQQMLRQPFRKIDAVLVTHSHYDHVGGMDDVRPFCMFGDINVYCDPVSERSLRATMPYCFAEHLYPGVPKINLVKINSHQQLTINELVVTPFQVMHDKLPILGFKVGNLAYITDMKTIDDEEIPLLQDIDYLVVNALRFTGEHHSHMLVDEAVTFARRTSARQVYFTHMCHEIGLHEEINKQLPSGFQLAYDGEVVDIKS